jgi:hypothetical protein
MPIPTIDFDNVKETSKHKTISNLQKELNAVTSFE